MVERRSYETCQYRVRFGVSEMAVSTVYCNHCESITAHAVVAKDEDRYIVEPGQQYGYSERWEVLRCSGCDATTVRQSCWENPDNAAPYYSYCVTSIAERSSMSVARCSMGI